ncbi:MAG: tyrosine-type recombinase/integrase [Planctomycetota bacterium]
MAARMKRENDAGSMYKEGAGSLSARAKARLERDESIPWVLTYTAHDGKRRKKRFRGSRKDAEAMLEQLTESRRSEGTRRRLEVRATPIDQLLDCYLYSVAAESKVGKTPKAKAWFAEFAEGDAPPADALMALGGRPQKVGNYLKHSLSWLKWRTPEDIELSRASAYAVKIQSGAFVKSLGGISKVTIRQRIQALKSFSGWIAVQGATADPLEALKLPKVEETDTVRNRRVLGDADFYRLVEHAGEHPDVVIETPFRRTKGAKPEVKHRRVTLEHRDALWLLLGEAGLRRGEAGTLTPERLRLDGEDPVAMLTETKTGEARQVPLSPELAAALRPLALRTPRGHSLFPEIAPESLGGPKSPMNIALVLRADLDALRIPVETDEGLYDCHAMRKEAVTRFALRGVPQAVAAKIVGHKPGSRMTSEVYTKVNAEQMHAEVRKAWA